MSQSVYLTNSAKRDLDRLDADVRDRIVAGIRHFAETSHGDVRKQKGVVGLRRLRVGDWRVIYRISGEDEIEVEAIIHRSKGYQAREDVADYAVAIGSR